METYSIIHTYMYAFLSTYTISIRYIYQQLPMRNDSEMTTSWVRITGFHVAKFGWGRRNIKKKIKFFSWVSLTIPHWWQDVDLSTLLLLHDSLNFTPTVRNDFSSVKRMDEIFGNQLQMKILCQSLGIDYQLCVVINLIARNCNMQV